MKDKLRYKKIIKEFMKQKNQAIVDKFKEKDLQPINLYQNSDYNWVNELSFKQLEKIYNKLNECFLEYSFMDTEVCPQCILFFKNNCIKCSYSGRNKKDYVKCACDHKSVYSSINQALKKTILSYVLSDYHIKEIIRDSMNKF